MATTIPADVHKRNRTCNRPSIGGPRIVPMRKQFVGSPNLP